MPRPRVHVDNLKTRQSKTRKENASKAPGKLGSVVATIPAEIKADKIAHARYKSALRTYAESGFELCEGDLQALCRLCFLYSEEARLKTIIDTETDTRLLLKLMSTINGARTKILALENVLYLNPVSRMRSFPTSNKPKSEEPSPMEKQFPEIF